MMNSTDIFLNNARVCCISDVHIGVHQNSNVWHDIVLDWAKWLSNELKTKGISDIIISGDFFHYRDEIAVNTIHFATTVLNEWKDFNIIMLVGNHDAYYKDRSDVNSLSVLDGWNNITVVSTLKSVTLFNKHVQFCPWGTTVDQISNCDVIFGHFEIKTFKQNTFKICSDGMTSRELINKCPLIISGHFHLREERVYKDGTILYLGNPFHMDFGDVNQIKGYYILDLDTLKYTFTENNISPRHEKVYLSDLVKLGNITKQVKSRFKQNFVKFIIDKNISPDEVDIVLNKFSSLNPMSINVDYAVNYNKYKIDESNIHDFSGIDIETAIKEFVNLMDIDNKKEVVDYTVDLYRRCA
jgi:DNA repair exonuclease SbcCD nuclease subunit